MKAPFDPPALLVHRVLTNVPSALLAAVRWMLWSYAWKNGRWTKQPLTSNGFVTSASNRTAWRSFQLASEAVIAANGARGLGWAFHAPDGLIGVDFDRALAEDGKLLPWAADVLHDYRGYIEVSPSGRGLKLWTYAPAPPMPASSAGSGRKSGRLDGRPIADDGVIEVYAAKRFFTVTGRLLPWGSSTVEQNNEWAHQLYRRCGFHHRPDRPCQRSQAVTPDDDLIIRRVLQSRRGHRLWNGDAGDYGGDVSRADAALLCLLARHVGADPQRIEKLFGLSARVRPKWAERSDYRSRSIGSALAFTFGCRRA